MVTSDARVIRPVAEALAAVVEHLRQITVRIEGRSGHGSGVIWRSDGWIVTNAHVVQRTARVSLPDGRGVDGDVIAWDPERDLAAIRIDAGSLPAATLGSSNALRVGELVVAVGHPLGLAGAVTVGILHAVGSGDRSGRARWLQADLRLEPGNSGGPLADAGGRVIGINAMIAGGLALAVPSDSVEEFLRGKPAGRRSRSDPAAAGP